MTSPAGLVPESSGEMAPSGEDGTGPVPAAREQLRPTHTSSQPPWSPPAPSSAWAATSPIPTSPISYERSPGLSCCSSRPPHRLPIVPNAPHLIPPLLSPSRVGEWTHLYLRSGPWLHHRQHLLCQPCSRGRSSSCSWNCQRYCIWFHICGSPTTPNSPPASTTHLLFLPPTVPSVPTYAGGHAVDPPGFEWRLQVDFDRSSATESERASRGAR